MPIESGRPGGMNRREFFKKTATLVSAAGFLVREGKAGAQEKQNIDSHVDLFLTEADAVKINFPDKFEPITPQIKAIIASINNYRLASSDISTIGSDADILLKAKREVWITLKELDSSLPQFSDDIFYKTLADYKRRRVVHILSGSTLINPELETIEEDFSGEDSVEAFLDSLVRKYKSP